MILSVNNPMTTKMMMS